MFDEEFWKPIRIAILIAGAILYGAAKAGVYAAYYPFAFLIGTVNILSFGHPVAYLYGTMKSSLDSNVQISYRVNVDPYDNASGPQSVSIIVVNPTAYPIKAVNPICSFTQQDGQNFNMEIDYHNVQRTSLNQTNDLVTSMPPYSKMSMTLPAKLMSFPDHAIIQTSCTFDVEPYWWVWTSDYAKK